MQALAEALPWVAFWAVVGLVIYLDHVQYMNGHTGLIYEHKTEAELRLQEAAVRLAELDAGIETKP
jgi:hypothetical protein